MWAAIRRILARVVNWRRSDRLDRDFVDELEHHIELATTEYLRRGMTEAEARRAARRELGNVTQLREAARETRGLPMLDLFVLDARLSLRVARKHWGLSLVAGLAMTVAITLAVVVFAFVQVAFGGKLPLDEGERVVALQIWDEEAQSTARTTLQDLEHWRVNVDGLEDLSAFRTVRRNLSLSDLARGTDVEPVAVAEMTASGFALARVRPFLGRTLQTHDETPGAEPVVVLGHREWSQRFGSDRTVLGRSLRLGGTTHTIVGVMPEGFRFPARHGFWTALPRGSALQLSAEGEARIFARLASGRSVEQVEAELTAAGFGDSLQARDQKGRLTTRVAPYALALTMSEVTRSQIDFVIQMLIVVGVLLLAPPSLNVAILVYARLVTRHREFSTRQALGASRGRILLQLFLEMLVLSVSAAVASLLIASTALRWFGTRLAQETNHGIPFWMDFSLGAESILFAGLLATIAALMAGILPGIGATRPDRQGGFRITRSDGPGLGRTWNLLVALQVAICLAALPATFELAWGTARDAVLGHGFDADRVLTAVVSMNDEQTNEADGLAPFDRGASERPVSAELAEHRLNFVRRLEREPGVIAASFATVPGAEPWVRIEFEGRPSPQSGTKGPTLDGAGATARTRQRLARIGRIDPNFDETLQLERVAGAWFSAGNFQNPRREVVVSEAFARRLASESDGADLDVLGGRLRYLPSDGTETDYVHDPIWYEIIGIVSNRPLHEEYGTVFHATPLGAAPPQVLIRLEPGADLAPRRLRNLAALTHADLRIEELQTLEKVYQDQQVGNFVGLSAIVAITLSALLLAAGGVYALMAFTVQQQRREIAIRTSLGAGRTRLFGTVMRRAFSRLILGGALGITLAVAIDLALPAERFGGSTIPAVVPATTVLLLGLGLLTAILPARRGLEIDPVAELKEG